MRNRENQEMEIGSNNRPPISREFMDVINPQAYLEMAQEGLAKFRELVSSVEK